ncbi:amino acid/polyamine transporter I [Purpureocillium lilacinum]|uniref:Amino acid/polyamine transporter I n=1 Tax=Purpureocillium lilacinum TaxID=33203 RepID=A0A179HL70_PURLI|nr:amino acid/polyamine transporter I [Purpureocillium lilacinum]OAQ83835.1 amino acid/polyamine transporter I [Purpureocillium lilacinum]OAQ90612.1 amino acid/polyamine transporter I [Purpureocillium lilacinum]
MNPEMRPAEDELSRAGTQDVDLAKTHTLTDEQRLAQLGHQQELRRTFSLPALLSFILSLICSLCIAASLAEIASIYPTAGGQYHWVAALCPAPSNIAASFATGWISVGGQIVFTASAAFAAGLQIQALIVLNNETYSPERWHGMLLYFAVLTYAGVLNIFGMKAMPHVNLISGFIHVAGLVAITVALGVLAPKSSSAFVWTEFVNSSGWGNDGVSWLVGLISAVYPFLGYDAACHLAEELPRASRNVPLAMVGSVAVNGIMGLAYCIVLLYCAGQSDFATAPLGFPYMQIYLDVTKSRAGTSVMSVLIILIAIAATIAGIMSTSRTLWAFARDKATPFDKYLSHVHPKLQIPVRSVVVVTVLQGILGFIYLGNSTAFNAILSMAIISMYLSYILPIIYMLLYGRGKLRKRDFGPFRLGRVLGIIMNVVGIAWMLVVMVFSTFPTIMPVTAENMNYSIVVLVGWTAFGVAYYVLWGKHKFEMPMVDVEVIQVSNVTLGTAEDKK